MKRFGIVPVLVLIALMLTFCGREYPFQFNAKFTATFDTPSGIKASSSVVYFKVVYPDPNFDFLQFPDAAVTHDFFEGEALTVDMGNNRVVFVLLTSQHVNLLAETLTNNDLFQKYGSVSKMPIGTKKIQERIDELKSNGTVVEIPPKLYPYFVMFDDLKNPNRLIKINPAAPFGPGYSLRSLTMTYTDEPVTTGKVMAAVGEGFFEKWEKRMLSDIDGVEWKKQEKEFDNRILYRKAFISEEK